MNAHVEAAITARATKRRDLPTATVISRLDPQTDRLDWLAVRRLGIGSSDMAAVLGMSQYRSELDVFWDKTGNTPIDDDTAGEAARWGTLLEDIIAREWAERAGVTVRRIGTTANIDRPHMICDLDRLVLGCPDHERCACEVKSRSAFKAEQWKDGAIPDDVEVQCQHQLAVTGLDAIHVAALVGGQRLESRLVLPDPAYIEDLYAVADEFWSTNVLGGQAPAISSLDLLVAHLNRAYPGKGTPVELGEAEEREVKHLTRIVLDAERHEVAAKAAKDRIRALIGDDGTDVVIGDDPWWTWRAQNNPKVLDRAAVEADLPRPLDSYKVSSGTTRVLRKGKAVKALDEAVADDD